MNTLLVESLIPMILYDIVNRNKYIRRRAARVVDIVLSKVPNLLTYLTLVSSVSLVA